VVDRQLSDAFTSYMKSDPRKRLVCAVRSTWGKIVRNGDGDVRVDLVPARVVHIDLE